MTAAEIFIPTNTCLCKMQLLYPHAIHLKTFFSNRSKKWTTDVDNLNT